MRLIISSSPVLLLLIQYPLWLGKGGWLPCRPGTPGALAQKKTERTEGAQRQARVRSARPEGRHRRVEERARSELGMIKENEIFVQIVSPNAMPKSATPVIAAPPPSTTTTTAHPAKKPGH
jgi:cell division protein FtsB